jgi:hypothetical protein
MSEELVKLNQLKADIIDAIVSAQVNSADEIAAMFSIPSSQALGLLNDANFLTQLTNRAKAQLAIAQHSKGTARLVKALDNDNDQVAMKAYELIAKITGTLKQSPLVEVNFNLESALDELEQKQIKVKQPVYDLKEFDLETLAQNGAE